MLRGWDWQPLRRMRPLWGVLPIMLHLGGIGMRRRHSVPVAAPLRSRRDSGQIDLQRLQKLLGIPLVHPFTHEHGKQIRVDMAVVGHFFHDG